MHLNLEFRVESLEPHPRISASFKTESDGPSFLTWRLQKVPPPSLCCVLAEQGQGAWELQWGLGRLSTIQRDGSVSGLSWMLEKLKPVCQLLAAPRPGIFFCPSLHVEPETTVRVQGLKGPCQRAFLRGGHYSWVL